MRLWWEVLRERMTMKTRLMVVCVAVAWMAGAMAQTKTNAPAGSAASTNAVVGVEKFMRGVEGYRGLVQVEGVVQKVSARSKSMALIDVEEFRKCGLADCADAVLPVRWAGKLPEPGQAVRVTGEVQKQKGKLVFMASELARVELGAGKK